MILSNPGLEQSSWLSLREQLNGYSNGQMQPGQLPKVSDPGQFIDFRSMFYIGR